MAANRASPNFKNFILLYFSGASTSEGFSHNRAINLENQFPQQGNNFILIGTKFKNKASVLKSSPHSRASSLYSVLYTHQYNFKGRIFKILVGQMSSKARPTIRQAHLVFFVLNITKASIALLVLIYSLCILLIKYLL
jgi:hypothetical protein